jgi:archaellum component FlaF (FlaF/FlaG flagellin family)
MVVMEAGIMFGSAMVFGYVYLTFLKKMVRVSEDNMEKDEARKQRKKGASKSKKTN